MEGNKKEKWLFNVNTLKSHQFYAVLADKLMHHQFFLRLALFGLQPKRIKSRFPIRDL